VCDWNGPHAFSDWRRYSVVFVFGVLFCGVAAMGHHLSIHRHRVSESRSPGRSDGSIVDTGRHGKQFRQNVIPFVYNTYVVLALSFKFTAGSP